MASRKCENWLLTLDEYAEENETPRHFWTWAGLFVLSTAVQRKIWTPFGQKKLFPNLYVMIIAPPGWARKSVPLRFSKRILKELDLPIFVDSPSKRAFTKQLDTLSRRSHFDLKVNDRILRMPQSPLSCISPELSSFFALDIKNMVEILTDLYDCPDTFDYLTANSGEDKVVAPYITCLFASTPSWIASNLPQEAIGGGFTRRCVVVYGDTTKKELSLPPPSDERLYRMLVQDLQHITGITGEFQWSTEAFDYYDSWYKTLREKLKLIQDEKIQPFLSEVHSIAIKTAILAHTAWSDDLVISYNDMRLSIELLEKVIDTAGKAFSSHGRSETAEDTNRVMMQLQMYPKEGLSEAELLSMNYRNTSRPVMAVILDTLVGMEKIKAVTNTTTGKTRYYWIKQRR